jgi:hypothetical protein
VVIFVHVAIYDRFDAKFSDGMKRETISQKTHFSPKGESLHDSMILAQRKELRKANLFPAHLE